MTRDESLPDFSNPPVTEVVLGVQFDTITGFLSPHIGLAWEKFRSAYPRVEEHPVLPPSYELFGPGPHVFNGMPFMMPFSAPRMFFINEQGSELYQFQSDRILHNWRRLGATDEYPRYEHLRAKLVEGYKYLEATLHETNLGGISPNQCEITYVNHLEAENQPDLQEVSAGLFEGIDNNFAVQEFGAAEDIRLLLRYPILHPETGVPIGRLLVSREPVFRIDGKQAIQLSLTVRGKPTANSLDGVVRFLDLGREGIVKSFTNITNNKLHALWGRTR